MNEKANSDTARMRKSLRPVLIVSNETVTEYTTFLRHLLVGFVGESLSTVLIRPPGCDMEPIVPAPVTVLTHPLLDMPLTEHLGVERLALQLEKCRPTVLHCLSETRMCLARRLARRLNLPYVQAVNSLSERFSRLSVSPEHCQAIAVPTETVRAGVARACFRFADRVRQINIGTCVEREPVCFSEPSRLPSIVMAQSFRRVSDFENVFKAIKALLAEGREFVVVVMGPGAAERHLRRFLAQHDLAPAVTIVPTLQPWRSVLAACLGGVDDMIIPNQTAAVFEPDSEPSIRRTLARLLDQHDFAQRLARTAQEHVRASYSASTMIADTLKTYTEAQRHYHG